MSKSIVIFKYESSVISIQCSKKEKMEIIIQKFCSKIQKNIDDFIYLYGGDQVNFKLAFEEQANHIDREANKMIILVYKYRYECPYCGKKIKKDKIIFHLEKEISQLKQIIEQKDQQILFLNKKINNIENIKCLPITKKDDEIKIGIHSEIKRIRCNKNDKALALIKKLNSNLTINYRPINLNKTLEENGFYNDSIINMTEQIYNLNFEKKDRSRTPLPLDGNCPFSEAIIFYFNRLGKTDLYLQALSKKIYFKCNSKNLDINDKTPINKIFTSYSPLINVIELGDSK